MRTAVAARVLTLWIFLPLAACGDDGGEGEGGAPGLTCATGEVAVQGTIDGEAVDVRRQETGHAFINKLGSDPGSLNITLDGGELYIAFNELVANGGSAAARGYFQDAASSLDAGNCDTGDFVSTLSVDDDGDGGTFVLRSLHQAPYCTGAAVSGELTGCFRYP